MDFDRITHPLRLARGTHQPGSGKGCAMNVIADGAAVRLERLVRPLLRGVNHSSEEIHVGDPHAGDQPRTRKTDRKTPPSTQAALSSGVHDMNCRYYQSEQWANKGSLVIAKVLVGAAAAVISVGLAAPAGASPVPPQHTPQEFLAVARAAGITGTDPAMLGDGYNVCWQLWNQHASGIQVAAGLARDHPQLTNDEAAHFVLAAYDDLCPVPGAYDYWAYSTS
jgi:Protein of unknown function (DUF732)